MPSSDRDPVMETRDIAVILQYEAPSCSQTLPSTAPKLPSPYTSSVETLMTLRMEGNMRHASKSTWVPAARKFCTLTKAGV